MMNQFQHNLYILLVIIIVHQRYSWCSSLATTQVPRQGCLERCGDIEIPYPFGVENGCYFNSDFFMNCTQDSSGSPLLLFGDSQNEVISITLDGQLRLFTNVGKDCYYRNGTRRGDEYSTERATVLNWIKFPISNTHNKFTAVGCDTKAVIGIGNTTTGCISLCNGNEGLESISYDGSCSGLGCCQITIPKNCLFYDSGISSLYGHTNVWEYNPCSFIFVVENGNFTFSRGDLYDLNNRTRVPTVLDWAIGKSTCENAITNTSNYVCGKHSKCVDSTNGPGYRCNCSEGFQGNPYMLDGCEDINECTITLNNPCGDNKCQNNFGNYTCICNDGYEGDARRGGGGCQKIRKTWIEITVGIVVGLAAFLIAGSWLLWGYNKRKHLLLRHKFFKQNGGLMLQKELSGKEGYNETARIFTSKELKAATNNFDESRIIGKGGFGVVYKGILEDEKLIAIKKSKVIDQDQIEQFINEVIVLSQINHRNVVKLLGCCLETQVPLLVYEYIDNGTLHDHLHKSNNKESSRVLSWENRLRISAEIAGVLEYLHSDAAVPIIHRDIKSTNILLDHNYIAKVSDFGASRLVPKDQDQLSTMVQGTMGYLDPEYMHTSQLTKKSDVYSFGVVLVELMTGKKALAFDRPEEERCLAMFFIIAMNKNNLSSVIENDILKDENDLKQIEEVARLAVACLRLSGEERPSMREVASELQGLLNIQGKQRWQDVEETEHLLTEFIRTTNNNRCNTSIGYENITKHVLVPIELEDRR